MTPEAKARQLIDSKLDQAGWVIQDMKQLNLGAGLGVAVREYPTDTGPADYVLFLNREAVGVIDAIGAAQGFTRDTAKKKIFLIHQDQPKSLIPINLNNMLKTGDMSQNVTLREGDILYLTKNHRIDFARDIAPIFSSIYMITEAKDNLDNN